MNNKSALGILFRIPEQGRVKKRLAAQIGADRAYRAYLDMLYETLRKVKKLKGIDLYGFYDGNIGTYSVSVNLQTTPQQGNDLGERMLNAIYCLIDKGYKKVVLIGADSPDLPLEYIKDAFKALDSYELVIGPAVDGGYYLIGMKRPMETVFKDIKWGSSTVMKDTISIAEKKGIDYFLLPRWYDIDNIESLDRWKTKYPISPSLKYDGRRAF